MNMKILTNECLILDYRHFCKIIFNKFFEEGCNIYLHAIISELKNRISNKYLIDEITDFTYKFEEIPEEDFYNGLDVIVINLRLSLVGQ